MLFQAVDEYPEMLGDSDSDDGGEGGATAIGIATQGTFGLAP